MKPKPRSASDSSAIPSLSNPAASPTGLENVKPKRRSLPKGLRLNRSPKRVFVRPGEKERECNASSWAVSAGKRNSKGRSNERYSIKGRDKLRVTGDERARFYLFS